MLSNLHPINFVVKIALIALYAENSPGVFTRNVSSIKPFVCSSNPMKCSFLNSNYPNITK